MSQVSEEESDVVGVEGGREEYSVRERQQCDSERIRGEESTNRMKGQ